jgi:general secretion pathway protein L
MSASRIETYRKQFQFLASRTGADRFLSWWLKELSTLVPAWMRAPGDQADSLILLEMERSMVVLKQPKQGKWLEAGRLERNGVDLAAQRSAFLTLLKKLGKQLDEVGISLATTHVLRKRLKLPLAVEENLPQVLGFEMDRHTPFKSDQVYFDYRIIGRDAKAGQLDVQIVLAPRPAVDEMLALAKSWGASVQGVWLDTATGQSAAAGATRVGKIAAAPCQHCAGRAGGGPAACGPDHPGVAKTGTGHSPAAAG